MKFYYCKHCGNIIHYLNDSGVKVVCCGEEMSELLPNTVEAAVEKHLPVVTLGEKKVSVDVGSVDHPMTPEHHIAWVALESSKGVKIHNLTDKPHTSFHMCSCDEPIAVYAYCNLHGLWKTEIK
ncbi:MAG: desulfoferrodoxin family protein [Erysipelotrichaceae bacterium]